MPTIEILEASGKKQEMIEEWNSMLAHQIADLEQYEYYWKQLAQVFNWLNR